MLISLQVYIQIIVNVAALNLREQIFSPKEIQRPA